MRFTVSGVRGRATGAAWRGPGGVTSDVVHRSKLASTDTATDIATDNATTATDTATTETETEPGVDAGAGVAPQSADELATLVGAARDGDRAAFDELVRWTYVDTYTLALRLTGNEDDAGDVVQEAYLRAYRGLRRFRGDARFTTWLYRITANCASTHLGRRARHAHDDLDDETQLEDVHPDRSPVARAETTELRAELVDVLRELPPKLRAVVVLRDVYDLPHEAIAAELGISESAAKVRLHRARKRLRDELLPAPGEARARAG